MIIIPHILFFVVHSASAAPSMLRPLPSAPPTLSHTHNSLTHARTTLSHDIDATSAWQAWHLWDQVAGVALGDIDVSSVWQACYLVPQILLCVGGMAVGGTDVPFGWQMWHLVTLTVFLRGRRGTCGTGPGLAGRFFTKLCPAGLRGRFTHNSFTQSTFT